MVPLTRRRLLHGAAGLAAGVAGCNEISGSNGSTRTSSPTADQGTDRNGNSATEPDAVRVRVDEDRPPIWLATSDKTDGRPTPGDRSRHHSSIVVDDQDRADRIEIVDVPASERARSFLATTTFGRETVYIETHRVRACFRLDLCRISWGSTRVTTDYARTILPYDERCAADAWVTETWLIRIPAALSGESVNEYGSSVGSGDCDRTASRGKETGEHGRVDETGTAATVSHPTDSENASDGGQ